MVFRTFFLTLLASLLAGPLLLAQPVAIANDISVRRLMPTASSPIRIEKHPLTQVLYYLTDQGNVYRVDTAAQQGTLVFSTTDHGLTETFGLAIGATGNFYLSAAEQVNGFNVGKVAKGSPDGSGGYTWSLLAETEPYRASGNRDHKFNAIIESADGQYVYVNSGSRTDHGEEAENDGLREMPITAAILQIPVTASNLYLENDSAFLVDNGYLFADGVRNTFDLAYAPNGDLFGVENSDTRANEEELNWLQAGHHYGFPWKIGTHHNPQQFADFFPPGSDNLLVDGINMEGTFYNDPTFPVPPAGVAFDEPVRNLGPHADMIRDSVDGEIKDANAIGRVMGTFTPHSSPVALVFDTEQQLGGAYQGTGFAMSYNASRRRKYTPFFDPGEDLLWLQLRKDQGMYTTQVTRVAYRFDGPIDAELLGNKLYVLEYAGQAIWELTFPSSQATSLSETDPSLSGLVQLSPQPAGQRITLQTMHPACVIREWCLYDLHGRMLRQQSVARSTTIELTVGDLAPGSYVLHLATNRGLVVKRFVRRE